MLYDIAIVGAGASGIVAAISAKKAQPNVNIILLEAMPRVGKKILATGNGRCNLTNINADASSYNDKFVTSVLGEYPPQAVLRFFTSIGLATVTDSEGRVYPMSNTANSVLDCLCNELERLKIEIRCEEHIDSVKHKNDIFELSNGIKCKKLILSCGGKASPSQGSDGSGYKLLERLGHKIIPTYPGLVQLRVKENVKALKGCRVKANVMLCKDKNILAQANGEVLFTDYGLSGIAIMDISRKVGSKECICKIDMLPVMSFDNAVDFIMNLKKHNPELTLSDALAGMLPFKVGQAVLKSAGIPVTATLKKANEQMIKSVISTAKAMSFTVTDTNGFNNAQITVGGADLSEFDSNTLQSNRVKGLYCTGELLDIDSVCGGFNLQWAWASGLASGKHASCNL